ncbi:MAG: transposase, partial [bacterium]|nr:transposase [bacterium]
DGAYKEFVSTVTFFAPKPNHSNIVQKYLERSRIKIIFLPTYSPNLNLIERLWNFFKKKVMRGKYYVGFLDFKESIIKFFRNISVYKPELKSLLTEKFQLIGS